MGLINDAADGGIDARGNIVGENVGCYPLNPSSPGYLLPAGSPCIDRGATAPRKDTSVIAKDLDGRARSQGAAPDIGAWERQ